MLAPGATPTIGTPASVDGQPRTEQGMTLPVPGASKFNDWTSAELVLKRKMTWPAITVLTQVPCGPLSVLVAEVTGSWAGVRKLSPPRTEPAIAGTTDGLLATPLSMTPTTRRCRSSP